MIDLLLTWAVPSMVGFGSGFLLALLVRRTVEFEDSPIPEVSRRGQLARVVFGVLLLCMATVSFIQAYRDIECTKDGIAARSEANGAEARAQIDLFSAILDGDPTNNRAATERYYEAAQELERVRAENPLECR